MIFNGAPAVRQAFTYNILRLHIDDGQGSEVDFDMGAIRYGKWKLLNFRDTAPLLPLGTWELYDLAADPEEANDVFAAEPEVAAKMVEKFQV